MNDYLMFIDTEASALPKRWDLPYSAEDNWPHCVQISWIIYTNAGEKVKVENHYIKNNDFNISKSAEKVHGINREFLEEHGEDRSYIMQLLVDDYEKFKPLVIGHFVEFDVHMIGADFHRTKIENPINQGNTFCTMLATTLLVKNPQLKFFKLGELYETLFNVRLANQHSALTDATATAACFFELLKRGEIDESKILQQQINSKKKERVAVEASRGCINVLTACVILNLIIFYFLWIA